MKFVYALTAAVGFAGSAFSAPAADLPVGNLDGLDLADVPDAHKELAAPIGNLITSLGLGGVASGLTGVVSTVTGGLGSRELPEGLPDIPELSEVPEVPGLSPAMVKQTVTSATVVFQKLNIKDLKNLENAKQVDVAGIDTKIVGDIVDALVGILEKLGLLDLVEKLLDILPLDLPLDLPLEAGNEKVSDLEGGLPVGLLASIAPGLAQLLTALGLGGLAPGLVSILGALSEGL